MQQEHFTDLNWLRPKQITLKNSQYYNKFSKLTGAEYFIKYRNSTFNECIFIFRWNFNH